MKRPFEVKQKVFFLVPKVLSFGHTKQNIKNVADTTFKDESLYIVVLDNFKIKSEP